MFDTNYIRYNATHDQKIVVYYQDERDYLVKEQAEALGLQILTCNQSVADVFGVDVVKDMSVLRSTHLEAIEKGEHVFFIEYGSHTLDWIRLGLDIPKRDFDSGYAGLIRVPHDSWLKANPRSTYAKRHVFKTLRAAFEDRVSACLNGMIYEACVETEDDDVWYSGYIDPEEALADAMRDFPEIKYKPEDFSAVTIYTLREECH